ncbi:MAG: hypothetical protein H0Z32_04740 [Bacillaceae bacterium]|nr:hypothetical protein [Bacillaceae bacterium]
MKKRYWFLFLFSLSIVLMGCTERSGLENEDIEKDMADWELDQTFEHDHHTFIGEAGRIGLTNFSDQPVHFQANKKELFFWRFYGEPGAFEDALGVLEDPERDYGDRFKIEGIHKETGKKINLLKGLDEIYVVPFHSPNDVNGVSTGIQIQESMVLPEKGTWKLAVYFDGRYFDHVTIDVN